jgi:hypothetical protein
MRGRRRREAAAHDPQAAGVVHGLDIDLAAAEHVGAAVLADPALESLHVNEAREALVRGSAHPLPVGLHQFQSMSLLLSDQEEAGCPLLKPQPPHASACRGEETVLVGAGAGIKLARSR